MKKSELYSLMTELLGEENTDLDNQKFSERALAIIKEISKFAKEQPLYQANRDKEKQFKTKTAWDVFTFMLFKIADALTEVQECTVVILLMPVLYDKLKSEGGLYMKIKKAFDICKKSKVICLFTDGTTQYLGDGNAVYPLAALPELDENYICQLYDINDSQREKIQFKINEPLPYEFSFADSTHDESAAMLHDINIQLEGVGVCIPVMTERGIKFIKSVYLAPLSDTDSRDIHYFLRQTPDGREYFAVKVGLLLYAIITPVNIINQPFVDKLYQLYHYSKLALENSGETEK